MGSRDRNSQGGNAGRKSQGEPAKPVGVRIIGGRLKGSKLEYSGDLRTRPMKDRVREAQFNRLGRTICGKVAVDLFAGTGALGLEAISRGAVRAVLVEQHLPTARAIRRTAEALGIGDAVEVVGANTFLWCRRHADLGTIPWVVFCSPPYDFFVERADDMLELLGGLIATAPLESIFVVESDERFDFNRLPTPELWDVRAYPPAVVGIYYKREMAGDE